MRINSKVYDIAKYCVLVFIPALTTFYVGLAAVLNLPYADEVAKVSALVCAFLGSILHISSKNYWENHSVVANESDQS